MVAEKPNRNRPVKWPVFFFLEEKWRMILKKKKRVIVAKIANIIPIMGWRRTLINMMKTDA
jgi:hypothetical protein